MWRNGALTAARGALAGCDEASRLGRVVSNVLGFSQLERGHLSVDAQVGPLGEALRELAERAQPTLDRAGATLALDVAPDLRARFDRDALSRIIGNLIDNAEKYARAADDRTIRLSALDRGRVVEVSIEDHGPGISDKTKLFRPFSRGASALASHCRCHSLARWVATWRTSRAKAAARRSCCGCPLDKPAGFAVVTSTHSKSGFGTSVR